MATKAAVKKPAQMSLGTNNLEFRAGSIRGTIFGGPFRDYVPGTRRLVGVKMAKEIDHPHDISIPTQDFSVPLEDDMQLGVLNALRAMRDGYDIYAGCMGGIGRTGLFFGCMAKVMIDFNADPYYDFGRVEKVEHFTDPVLLTRYLFKPHAIETEEQQAYVRGFNTKGAVSYLHSIQPDMAKYVQLAHHKSVVGRLKDDLDETQVILDDLLAEKGALERRLRKIRGGPFFKFFNALFTWDVA